MSGWAKGLPALQTIFCSSYCCFFLCQETGGPGGHAHFTGEDTEAQGGEVMGSGLRRPCSSLGRVPMGAPGCPMLAALWCEHVDLGSEARVPVLAVPHPSHGTRAGGLPSLSLSFQCSLGLVMAGTVWTMGGELGSCGARGQEWPWWRAALVRTAENRQGGGWIVWGLRPPGACGTRPACDSP